MTTRDIAAEIGAIAARLDLAIVAVLVDHPDAETLLRKYRNRLLFERSIGRKEGRDGGNDAKRETC